MIIIPREDPAVKVPVRPQKDTKLILGMLEGLLSFIGNSD